MSLMLTDDARPYSGKGIIITIERCSSPTWLGQPRAGYFDVFVADRLVCTSRQPIRDAARELIRRGFAPETWLTVAGRHPPNQWPNTLGDAARDFDNANVVPIAWRPPPPKRLPYRPDARNGTVGVIATEEGGFAVLHYSAGGGSAGLTDGFETLDQAQSVAWREARQKQAIFIQFDGEERS